MDKMGKVISKGSKFRKINKNLTQINKINMYHILRGLFELERFYIRWIGEGFQYVPPNK